MRRGNGECLQAGQHSHSSGTGPATYLSQNPVKRSSASSSCLCIACNDKLHACHLLRFTWLASWRLGRSSSSSPLSARLPFAGCSFASLGACHWRLQRHRPRRLKDDAGASVSFPRHIRQLPGCRISILMTPRCNLHARVTLVYCMTAELHGWQSKAGWTERRHPEPAALMCVHV